MNELTRLIVGLVAVLSVVAGGCAEGVNQSGDVGNVLSAKPTAANGDAALPVGEEETATKDQTRWTLPLDPYWAPNKSNLHSQASSILISDCMIKAGFPQYRPWWDMNAPKPENQTGDGINVFFNEDLAAKYGYRMAPDLRYLVESEIEDSGGRGLYADESDEFWDQFYKCQDDKDDQLAGGPGASSEEDPLGGIRSQMNQLRFEAVPELMVEAADKWRTCMAPLEIADLPNEPWPAGLHLPDSLMTKWNWQTTGKPSADEIKLP